MQQHLQTSCAGLEPEPPSCLVEDFAAVHYYVPDLDKSFAFFAEILDLPEIARSTPDSDARTGQRSVAFAVRDTALVVTAPDREDSSSALFLRRHPEGIGKLTFRVNDMVSTYSELTERGATFLEWQAPPSSGAGDLHTLEVASPIDDFRIAFTQANLAKGEVLPGFRRSAAGAGGRNRHRFTGVDHVTTSFMTVEPAALWFEKVLGLHRSWEISLHTGDPTAGTPEGSGLRSVVLSNPSHRVKLANNEPWAPNFSRSQISEHYVEHGGSGVQHVALSVEDILSAVDGLRQDGILFHAAPTDYYERLARRCWPSSIQPSLEQLESRNILLDGDGPQSYLLQIFMEPGASSKHWDASSPFFFELVQRSGERGFGEGNFRALFKGIERSTDYGGGWL